MKSGHFCVAFLLLSLAACAGRSAQPVTEVRSHDDALGCDHIEAEARVNLRRVESLVGERDAAQGRNVAFMLLMPIVAVPFFMDLSSTEQEEIQALEARNKRLAKLAEEKDCDLGTSE